MSAVKVLEKGSNLKYMLPNLWRKIKIKDSSIQFEKRIRYNLT